MKIEYNEILSEIKDCIKLGGEFIEITKDSESSNWIVFVTDKNEGIYFSYTLGHDNKDFLFDLINFCWKNKYQVNIPLS